MPITPPLALSNVVDITVTVSPAAAISPTFNQGLFIGSSTVIPTTGANSRVRQYASTTAMLTDGFTTASPEYIAAQIYFSQTPAPQFIWIGSRDLTSVQTLSPANGSSGTLWNVGDQFEIIQTGGSGGIGQVVTVDITSGFVTAVEVISGGTGYSVVGFGPSGNATGSAIAPSLGINMALNIADPIGETFVQAAEACREASGVWYGLAVYNPSDADNLALAAWADPLWQSMRYYAWSSDAGIPAATAGNLALQLQTLKYRTLGIYATTQGGLYPNNIYAAAGLMGLEMGYNTGLAGSFFTVAHKQIAGIAVEPVTQTQYTNIRAADFSVYGNFSPYQLLEAGFLSNGSPSYLWLNLAMLVSNMQINCVNVLQANPAVPQTNAGEHLFIQAVNNACDTAVGIGFLSGGVWDGSDISIPGVQLSNGQALPSGYLNQAQPYAQQSPANRAAGQAMPIYSAIITSGATLSLMIGVYTQL